MTKAEMHKIVDYLYDTSPFPVRAIGVTEYDSLHEIHVAVTFKTPEPGQIPAWLPQAGQMLACLPQEAK